MVNKQILDIFEYDNENSRDDIVHISNSVISYLYFPAFEIQSNIIIENCIINKLIIYNTWFEAGFTLKNSIIKTKIEYEAGGHNKAPFIMENNIFEDYVNFFDCQFEDLVIISNNIFLRGSNLLLKKDYYTDPSFIQIPSIQNNIGDLAIPCSEPMDFS